MAGRACALSSLLVAVHGVVVVEEGTSLRERFGDYVRAHGRGYAADAAEYERRYALFRRRHAEVEAQNARPARRWTAAVNGLADRSEAELAALRGYRHGARTAAAAGWGRAAGLNLAAGAAMQSEEADLTGMPPHFSWRRRLKAMAHVVDQGECGSCWAISSATALRAHAELYQTDQTFSAQQLVDCTPNPRHCGGKGGCSGATAELAMEYAARRGLVADEDWVYTESQEDCPASMRLAGGGRSSFLAVGGADRATVSRDADGAFSVKHGEGAKFGLVGWRRLPENEAAPLIAALYSSGPVVVSVSASDAWDQYGHGVFDACERGAVINHAVVLTGFGRDDGAKYWELQNSWGKSWGEAGFMRLLRREARDEDAFCGWDKSPREGTACAGGPSKVWVCGSCGVLYDGVVPTFRLSPKGWWHRHGNRSMAI